MTLKFFASPLHEHTHDHDNDHDYSQVRNDKTLRVDEASTSSDADEAPTIIGNNDQCLHDDPKFHRHAEATNIELFFDLFFVANLTTFTGVHEVNDHKQLTSYIGFFSVLWFTWYQVSLYDVRFSTDSVFERICKALHFGVMTGFAVTGPQYKTDVDGYWVGTFRALSLILMVSRLVLCLQYSVVLFATRSYRKMRLPLMLIIGSTFLAAVLYAVLTPIFPKTLAEGQKSHVFVAFYVIAVCETIVTAVISCTMRGVSFKGTHFVQRMSLLTLIILGEGVIVLTKAILHIVKNLNQFSAGVVGQIVSSVLIIYFLYMLYFDRLQTSHFGTIRQQLWAFAHFPLHIAFVLLLEGDSQLILWRQAFQTITELVKVVSGFMTDYSENADTSVQDLVNNLNVTAWAAAFSSVPEDVDAGEAIKQVNEALAQISEALGDGSSQPTAKQQETVQSAVMNFLFAVLNTILESLGIKAGGKVGEEGSASPEDTTNALESVLELVYIYTFVAAGLTLIILAIISFISNPPNKVSAWVRFGVHVALGLGLSLLALTDLTSVSATFVSTPWVLPTLCLVIFAAVLTMHVSIPKRFKRMTA